MKNLSLSLSYNPAGSDRIFGSVRFGSVVRCFFGGSVRFGSVEIFTEPPNFFMFIVICAKKNEQELQIGRRGRQKGHGIKKKRGNSSWSLGVFDLLRTLDMDYGITKSIEYRMGKTM
eukprot:sb/3476477/